LSAPANTTSRFATVSALTDPQRNAIVQTKATCPFIGAAVATGRLPVRNDADNPLAAVEDVRELGNSGGGDLGDLLTIFAAGNHAFIRGATGKLDQPAPEGLFSLEFPGSQGSHPGHSGMLQGDPRVPGSGRFSQADFDRLTRRSQNGFIKRSDVGQFIAENLQRDPESKVFGSNVAALLARDLGSFAMTVGPALQERVQGPREEAAAANRALEEKLTRLLGEDNLIGSAGEFGLLFAFLAHKADARSIDGEPAISTTDLRAMFIDKRFPEGWETWKKTRADWVTNTTSLLISAGKHYLALKKEPH
jgi:hypothetical protein